MKKYITRKIDVDIRNAGIDTLFNYDGFLGYKYSKNYTEFRIYAPTSNKIELILNDERIVLMTKNEEKGIFEVIVNGNLENFKYMYRIYFDDIMYETIDPYANACNANSRFGMIIDLSKTNPKNFNRMERFSNILNAIIYELHIRDFTLNSKNRGKYLGVVEKKQLNYLKKLGITHVQILPFYDYSSNSVDELNPDLRYNWGYDPVNYNIPEGSYSSNPENPYTRIKELKQMINILHKNGIRVIMDVVYNHVFDAMAHSFSKTLPGYAFRMDENLNFSNGTACGNDVASERKMIRKYIVDSVKYWASEYNLDGFRFDLMGILDIDTMNEIRRELDKIDDSIIILGEGWDLNTALKFDLKANQNNACKMPNIAFFNDDMRDSLRGNTFEKLDKGFVNEGTYLEERLIKSIKGGWGLKSYINPNQLIQYIEAHDNNTVFDHFQITNSNLSDTIRIKMQAIATSIVLTSQGIPFLHAGQEFFRTKFGVENSYKSSDEINKFDFERAKKYKNYVEYFSDLISFRKDNYLLKQDNYEKIEKSFKLIVFEKGLLGYSLNDEILILANANNKNIKINLEYDGLYKVEFSKFKKENKIIKINKKVEIPKLDFIILTKIKTDK